MHHNWIEGRERQALAAGVFQTPGTGELWPRSAAADATLALDSAARAAPEWNATDPARRLALVWSALAGLEHAHSAPGFAAAAARIGLSAAELAPRFAGLAARAPSSSQESAACVAILPHWSELGLAALTLAGVLARGAVAIVLADPDLPWIAEWIVQAFVRARVPPGALALLHDDGESTLRALVCDPRLARLEHSGPPARVSSVGDLVQHLGRAPILAARTLCSACCRIGRDQDPARAAQSVLAQAFGRAQALSGQAPGQIGRVLCHEHVFSRFSEALFLQLEAMPALPALVERECAEHLGLALELGLDEGATLVHRGVEGRPLVFTNVDRSMRLARLARPAPLLCLLRVADDDEAAELASELDHAP